MSIYKSLFGEILSELNFVVIVGEKTGLKDVSLLGFIGTVLFLPFIVRFCIIGSRCGKVREKKADYFYMQIVEMSLRHAHFPGLKAIVVYVFEQMDQVLGENSHCSSI